MTKELSINDLKNYFHNKTDKKKEIDIDKGKIFSILRNRYSLSEDDLEDVYQESLTAFYLNIEKGKLLDLTESYFRYFIKICTNHALKLIRKNSKNLSLNDNIDFSNPHVVRSDKIDELYGFCLDTDEVDRKVRLHKLVNQLVDAMTDTCRNILKGYYWDDLSMATIADEYDYPNASSVKSQKYKCMKKYHNKFKELWEKIYG